MGIRMNVLLRCDHRGCEEAALADGDPYIKDGESIRFDDVAVPSGWKIRGEEVWCPKHVPDWLK